jgi:hypothetical protein
MNFAKGKEQEIQKSSYGFIRQILRCHPKVNLLVPEMQTHSDTKLLELCKQYKEEDGFLYFNYEVFTCLLDEPLPRAKAGSKNK